MRTLITGGTGTLGIDLARLLGAQDDALVLFDTAARPYRTRTLAPTATVVCGDLTDKDAVTALLRTYMPDRVFHLGGLLPGMCERNPTAAFSVNVQGTYNVLDAARLVGIRMVVVVCSAAAILHPTSVYGATKLCAEALIRSYHGHGGLDVRGVRLPPIIGLYFQPTDTPRTERPLPTSHTADYLSPQGTISMVASAMLQDVALGRPCAVTAPATAPVFSIYRRDAARALALVAVAPAPRLRRPIYNVNGAAGPPPTLGALAAALRAEVPDADLTFAPGTPAAAQAGSARYPEFDDAEAQADWGWRPTFTPAALARDVVSEARAHPELYARRSPRPESSSR